MGVGLSVTGTDTLSNGTDNTKFNDLINGVARAWCHFNGTGTPAIDDSYNIDSIVDNGTGDYQLHFTNDMPDVNYVVAGGSQASNNTINCDQYNVGDFRLINRDPSVPASEDHDDTVCIVVGNPT